MEMKDVSRKHIQGNYTRKTNLLLCNKSVVLKMLKFTQKPLIICSLYIHDPRTAVRCWCSSMIPMNALYTSLVSMLYTYFTHCYVDTSTTLPLTSQKTPQSFLVIKSQNKTILIVKSNVQNRIGECNNYYY